MLENLCVLPGNLEQTEENTPERGKTKDVVNSVAPCIHCNLFLLASSLLTMRSTQGH